MHALCKLSFLFLFIPVYLLLNCSESFSQLPGTDTQGIISNTFYYCLTDATIMGASTQIHKVGRSHNYSTFSSLDGMKYLFNIRYFSWILQLSQQSEVKNLLLLLQSDWTDYLFFISPNCKNKCLTLYLSNTYHHFGSGCLTTMI